MKVDFAKVTGMVKPVHGVGQPPILDRVDYSMFHYLKEAGVPFSRLHDTGGVFGLFLFVDIPNIFRDFSQDPADPAAYDFAFTDLLIKALVENGVEPYFRLGVTIENHCQIKAYRIYPPEDNEKWARICEGIIRHYTEGWANGYRFQIRHWEIWNEPDGDPDMMANCMWRGTFEQYMELYKVASKHLKKCFPHLKIGGYASCGFYEVTKDFPESSWYKREEPRGKYFLACFEKFLAFAKANNCPLDFFSFHGYDNPAAVMKQVEFARQALDKAGFTQTELSLNEWRPEGDCDSMELASNVAAMLVGLQNSAVNDAEIYDARCNVGAYSPLFHPVSFRPRPAYYALKSFNELYKRSQAVAVTGVPEKLWAAAAFDGESGALMIVNNSVRAIPCPIDSGKWKFVKAFVTSDLGNMAESAVMPECIPARSFLVAIYR